jgi:hypothetical protein
VNTPEQDLNASKIFQQSVKQHSKEDVILTSTSGRSSDEQRYRRSLSPDIDSDAI